MNKNIVYAVAAIFLLLVGAYFFSNNDASTNVGQENEVVATSTDTTATSSSTTSISTTSDIGNTNTNSGESQTVLAQKARIALGYPNSWPADVPTYPRQTVKYTGGNNPQSGPVEATIVFTTKDSVRNVVNFYLNGLKANGWKITEDGAGLANLITVRATKAKRGAGVYVERTADGKTTVTVGVNIGI